MSERGENRLDFSGFKPSKPEPPKQTIIRKSTPEEKFRMDHPLPKLLEYVENAGIKARARGFGLKK